MYITSTTLDYSVLMHIVGYSKCFQLNFGLGSWWLFPKLGFVGLSLRDYLGEIFVYVIIICGNSICIFNYIAYELVV